MFLYPLKVIEFYVSVPVLSKQIVLTQPASIILFSSNAVIFLFFNYNLLTYVLTTYVIYNSSGYEVLI